MKRIITYLTAVIFALNIVFVGFISDVYALDRPLTLGNEVIQFAVAENGEYQIRTTDLGNPYRPDDSNSTLTFFDKDVQTSFTTLRVDGKDYIFGKDYIYSLSKNARVINKSRIIGNSIVTDYQIDDGITVSQILTFVEDTKSVHYGNVYIQYELVNTSGKSIEAGARILQDVMFGENDGVAIKVEDNFFDKEIVFTGEDVPDLWRATDNEFAPKLVGYGYTNGWGNVKPDMMIIGHWQGLSQTSFEYSVNTALNFTMESDYGVKDTAVAYLWNPRQLPNNQSVFFETYYGLGQIAEQSQTYATNILAPSQMTVNVSKTGYANNGEIEIAVMIENNLAESVEIYDLMAYLTFEDGDGSLGLNQDTSLKGVKLVKKNGQYTFRWKLKATPGINFQALRYKVDLYDSRHLYKAGDVLEGNKKIGDVKMEQIYTVTKTLFLPNVTGAAPQLGFENVTPNEIYYSGKNLVSIKTKGIDLLIDQENWSLEYKINNGIYHSVDDNSINVVKDTNTLEVMFEESFEKGEMSFRILIDNDIFTQGPEDEHILSGDIYSIPGVVLVTGDKAVIQRTYGMLALVQEKNNGIFYTLPFAVADEAQLSDLEQALGRANSRDGGNRIITFKIAGDIRSIKDQGQLSKYVVYAQHKKAIINDLITYTSAVPITVSYENGTSVRNTMDLSSQGSAGLSNILREELANTEILSQLFSNGLDDPRMAADVVFDFPFLNTAQDVVSDMNNTMSMISGGLSLNIGDPITFNRGTSDKGQVVITGLGILGINTSGGFDFWMDKFSIRFEDELEYGLWEATNPIRIDLEGVGAVLNKVMEGMPVQLNGVRLVKDASRNLDMLTFGATVNLKMIPGEVIVEAKDVFFSKEGYEGITIDAHVAPSKGIGIVKEIDLNILLDTYRDQYEVIGNAKVGVVQAHIEFSIMKEHRNDTWHLQNLILSGGGRPGIPVSPGVLYIHKLGGGVRNLDQLTNPYYDKPAQPFTVVLIAGLNAVNTLDGEFTGNITAKQMKISSPAAKLVNLDILKDITMEVIWASEDGTAFQINAGAKLNLYDILIGDMKITISDVFFEGAANVKVYLPKSIPLVGGKSIAGASYGINTNKIWGSVKFNLLFAKISVGVTYFWRGKFEFNTGAAGPLLEGPDAALYYGEYEDNNGDTIEYVVGTNVQDVGGIGESNLRAMIPYRVYKDSDHLTFAENLAESVNSFEHVDSSTSFDGLHIYEFSMQPTDETHIAFKYGEGIQQIANIDIFHIQSLVDAIRFVNSIDPELQSVEHVVGDERFMTYMGFEASDTPIDYIAVTNQPLHSWFSYTGEADYTDMTIDSGIAGYEHLYKLHINTTEQTQITLTHNGDLEVKIHTLNENGILTKASDVMVHKAARFNDQNLILIDGFTAGLADVVYYISANKPLTEQNILESRSIVIEPSSHENGSVMVAEFISESDISQADVFYITDADGNTLPFFDWNEAESIDVDDANVYSTTTIEGQEYYSMLFPFETEGTYYVHSTVALIDEYITIYEIENMPTLDTESILVKNNALSSMKKDVYWSGTNYRYSANELKNTEKTVFTFYMANETITLMDDGEYAYEPGKYLGMYEPRNGDDDIYTIDLPKDMPSGNYRMMVIMKTEGLTLEYGYSDVFEFVNPNEPKKVTSVSAQDYGSGFIHAEWEALEDAESFYVEVFDENLNALESFGVAVIEGTEREAVVGGVFESFDPNNPDEGIVIGLETNRSYRVGITPIKKIDENLTMTGETVYSALMHLNEPTPPLITAEIIEGGFGKSPKFRIQTDQPSMLTYHLNQVELQRLDDYTIDTTLQLDGLTEGTHYLEVVACNDRNDVSYDTFMFVVDTRPPELFIDSPSSADSIVASAEQVLVKGRTEVGATLTVNGQVITVNSDGLFEGNVSIRDEIGQIELEITAADSVGNETRNRIQLQRNTSPIEGFELRSDIPTVIQTFKIPVYETETEQIYNPFTGLSEEILMAKSDAPVSYEEATTTANVIQMGRTYHLYPWGTYSGGSEEVLLNYDRVDFTIEEGKSLADIDEKGKLTVKNNGTIVIKASFAISEDFAFEQYMTVVSEYADVYAFETGDQEDMGGNGITERTLLIPKVVSETGEFLSYLTLFNYMDGDKKLIQEVRFTKEQAMVSVVKALERQHTVIRLDLGVLSDKADKLKIVIANNALEVLVSENINVILDSAYGQMTLSSYILKNAEKTGEEIYFEFVNVTSNEEQKNQEDLMKKHKTGQLIAQTSRITFMGKVKQIRTNIPQGTVEMVLPIDMDALPADEETRAEYLQRIIVFIVHENGDEELKPAEIVEIDDKGNLGAKFSVNMFSIFSIMLVEELLTKEIDNYYAYVFGYSDGTFKPNNPITRAEIATILSRLYDNERKGPEKTYTDIDGHWAEEAIYDVSSKALVYGYPDGSFKPDKNITRAEMAAILQRWGVYSELTENKYLDISDHWAFEAIVTVSAQGILNGYPDGSFGPNKNATRAEFITVMNRITGRSNFTITVDSTKWPDIHSNHWAREEIEKASTHCRVIYTQESMIVLR